MRGLEREFRPGQLPRMEGLDLEGLGCQGRRPADHAGLEHEHHDRSLEARVQADDFAGLDQESGLLHRLAHGGLVHRLVDLEETTRLSPQPESRLDTPANEDDLTVVRDRQHRHDESGIDVRDVATAGAVAPMAILAIDGAEPQCRPAAGAEPDRVGQPARGSVSRIDVGRAAIRSALRARIAAFVRHA